MIFIIKIFHHFCAISASVRNKCVHRKLLLLFDFSCLDFVSFHPIFASGLSPTLIHKSLVINFNMGCNLQSFIQSNTKKNDKVILVFYEYFLLFTAFTFKLSTLQSLNMLIAAWLRWSGLNWFSLRYLTVGIIISHINALIYMTLLKYMCFFLVSRKARPMVKIFDYIFNNNTHNKVSWDSIECSPMVKKTGIQSQVE